MDKIQGFFDSLRSLRMTVVGCDGVWGYDGVWAYAMAVVGCVPLLWVAPGRLRVRCDDRCDWTVVRGAISGSVTHLSMFIWFSNAR
jgi:hypothetical protein